MTSTTAVKQARVSDVIDVITHTEQPRFKLRKNHVRQSDKCYVCGHNEGYLFATILNQDLTNEWQLSEGLRKSFDVRESSKCVHCKSSLRSNLQARAICAVVGLEKSCLEEAVRQPQLSKLSVAEINACGALHPILQQLPHLLYSEYIPNDKTVPHEDLHNLSYSDGSLDIVLTSDTLEHVPDWQQAQKEICRVLRPGGKHIFTVPAILTRRTRVRAVKKGDKLVHLLPPSFHGCTHAATDDYVVFNEFGADFRREIDGYGFNTAIYYRNALRLSDPNFVYVSTKV
jgi:hypothetical protein